jgi:8-oxo-dGTP pyrophosphatase MutT (NUDIX family)
VVPVSYRVGVAGVVRDPAGRVLLVWTARFGWELPGGGVEAREDLHAGLRREVREEGGCALDTIGHLISVSHDVRAQRFIFAFAATSSTPDPAPRPDEDDVRQAAWFTPPAALAAVTHPREHERLGDGLRPPGATIYRAWP